MAKNTRKEWTFLDRARAVVWTGLLITAYITAFGILWGFPWSKVSDPNWASVRVVGYPSLINSFIVVAHVLTALPPLMIGPWLFVRGLLKTRARFLHIWLGLVYVYCIFASSVLGFLLALGNTAGIVAIGGFGTLGVVWFITTFYAFRYARQKNWILHREWMIRSFMITLAVVTVRLLPAPQGDAMSAFYPLMTWLCWVPNAIIAELYVQLTDFQGRFNPGKRRELRAKRAARAARLVEREPRNSA